MKPQAVVKAKLNGLAPPPASLLSHTQPAPRAAGQPDSGLAIDSHAVFGMCVEACGLSLSMNAPIHSRNAANSPGLNKKRP